MRRELTSLATLDVVALAFCRSCNWSTKNSKSVCAISSRMVPAVPREMSCSRRSDKQLVPSVVARPDTHTELRNRFLICRRSSSLRTKSVNEQPT